jgi:hypothetical protein
VGFEFGGGRERGYEILIRFTSSLPICGFRHVVRAHGTGASRQYQVQPPWVKAVHLVRSGSMIVSPVLMVAKVNYSLPKIWSFVVEKVRPGGRFRVPVPMVAKATDDFGETSRC